MNISRGIKGATAILIAILIQKLAYAEEPFAASSHLSSGKWLKIAVTGNGVYRIDFTKLRQAGLSNPENPRIFGNNHGQLSYYNNDKSPDDLRELAVFLSKGPDGVFNEGDYLLFYGEATHRWRYNYSSGDYDFIRHNYSDTAFYFVTSSNLPGRQVQVAEPATGLPVYFTNATDVLFNHESETENLIKSGREWFQPVTVFDNIILNPGFTDLIPAEKISYRIRVLARSSVPAMFRFQESETLLTSLLVPEVYLLSSTGTYARDAIASGSAVPQSASPSYSLRFYNNGESGAKGWIDYVRLRAN